MSDTATRQVTAYDLGSDRPYEPVYRLQQRLAEARRIGTMGDALLLLEHSPVITLGRRADSSHILASPKTLAHLGVQVHQTDRGGDVTYHGPGQLIAYPVLALHDYGLGAGDYMHLLEELVIRTVADFGIKAERRDKLIGVWVGYNKICAMGVRIRRGVSLHGLALNVNPDMSHWELIVPCGIRDGGVTSLAQELGQAPSMVAVQERMMDHLADLLGVIAVRGDPAMLCATEADVPDQP